MVSVTELLWYKVSEAGEALRVKLFEIVEG
jgi:hypothetical protein